MPNSTALHLSLSQIWLLYITVANIANIRNDIDWTQIFIRYNVIEKSRYIKAKQFELQAENVTQSQFPSEVGDVRFKKVKHTSTLLSKVNNLMLGQRFMEVRTILAIVSRHASDEQWQRQSNALKHTELNSIFNLYTTDLPLRRKQSQPGQMIWWSLANKIE